jgi:glyoxylase-like metal-dependent hydrolase (beta-lactamase superfamily II)
VTRGLQARYAEGRIDVGVEIYSKRLMINRCYVIKDQGCVMVDAGPAKSEPAIEEWLGEIGIGPEELQLIVLTHGHFDHVGAALGVKEITGAKIAIHEDDQDALESGSMAWPSGVTTWGRIARTVLGPLVKAMLQFDETPADVVLGDEGLSLADYGIPGEVIHTPGHSPGSVSVLLETGDAFVGCMAHNALPFRLRPGLPIFADDLPRLRESWRPLLERGAETIYPAHGDPFPAEVIRKALA